MNPLCDELDPSIPPNRRYPGGKDYSFYLAEAQKFVPRGDIALAETALANVRTVLSTLQPEEIANVLDDHRKWEEDLKETEAAAARTPNPLPDLQLDELEKERPIHNHQADWKGYAYFFEKANHALESEKAAELVIEAVRIKIENRTASEVAKAKENKSPPHRSVETRISKRCHLIRAQRAKNGACAAWCFVRDLVRHQSLPPHPLADALAPYLPDDRQALLAKGYPHYWRIVMKDFKDNAVTAKAAIWRARLHLYRLPPIEVEEILALDKMKHGISAKFGGTKIMDYLRLNYSFPNPYLDALTEKLPSGHPQSTSFASWLTYARKILNNDEQDAREALSLARDKFQLYTEDYIQEKLAGSNGKGPLPYVASTVRSRCIDILRAKKRQSHKGERDKQKKPSKRNTLEVEGDIAPPLNNEWIEVIEEGMSELAEKKPRQADVLRLKMAGKEYSEITSSLGITEGCARVHLWHARKYMATYLSNRRCPDDENPFKSY